MSALLPSSRQKRSRSVDGPRCSFLCNPHLRDPLSVAVSFMPNPGPFRGCCRFTVEVWEQMIFLELRLPCPYVLYDSQGPLANCVPILPEKLSLLEEDDRFASSFYSLMWVRNDEDDITNPTSGFLLGEAVSCPERLKELTVRDVTELTDVPGDWLYNCKALEKVTLVNVPRLTTIGHSFLAVSRALTEVVLQDVPSLTEIGDSCLDRCTALVSFHLVDLPELTEIGVNFLYGCDSLSQCSLKDLPSLVELGQCSLCECQSLTEARFENLPLLTSLGDMWAEDGFLRDCPLADRVTFKNLPRFAFDGDDSVGDGSDLFRFSFEGVGELPKWLDPKTV